MSTCPTCHDAEVDWIGAVAHADDGDTCGEPRLVCGYCRREWLNSWASQLAMGRAAPRLSCQAHNRTVGIVWSPA